MVQTVCHTSINEDPESLDETFGLHTAFFDEGEDALFKENNKSVRKRVADLNPADFSELLENIETKQCGQLVETLKDQFNPDVLPKLDEAVRETIMRAMGFDDFVSALTKLDSEEAVDIAGLLDPDERKAVIEKLPAADLMQIEASLEYGEETAGRLLQRELVAVPDYWTVVKTIDYLRSARSLPDDFYVVFVVDPRHRTVGLVDLN